MSKMERPPTIIDVARRARLSVKTVSRVLNKEPHVSKRARLRVLSAIESLDYRPNAVARSLVTRRTRTIGLIVPDVCDPFWPEVVRGVESRAREAEYNILLCNTDEDPRREQAFLTLLVGKQVDGLILCSPWGSEAGLEAFARAHPRIVVVNPRSRTRAIPTVRVDFADGGYQAASHLIDHGYRRLGIATRSPGTGRDLQRVSGFRRALKDTALPPMQVFRIKCSATGWARTTAAMEAGRVILRQPQRPEAVLANDDLIALGFLEACQSLGLECPSDLAVIGYDDIAVARLLSPSLTSVAIPKWELGASAMNSLLVLLNGGTPGDVVIKPWITARRSCGCSDEKRLSQPEAEARTQAVP